MEISVVVPVFNEEENIGPLIEEIDAALEKFDANLLLQINRLTAGQMTAQDIRFDGTLVGGTMTVRNASVGDLGGARAALVAEVRRRFLPETVVLLHAPGEAGRALEDVAPFVAGQGPAKGPDGAVVPAAYVCRDRTCAAPVTTAKALAALLD